MHNSIKAIYISLADNSFRLDCAVTSAGCGLAMKPGRFPLGSEAILGALRILYKYRIKNEYIE